MSYLTFENVLFGFPIFFFDFRWWFRTSWKFVSILLISAKRCIYRCNFCLFHETSTACFERDVCKPNPHVSTKYETTCEVGKTVGKIYGLYENGVYPKHIKKHACIFIVKRLLSPLGLTGVACFQISPLMNLKSCLVFARSARSKETHSTSSRSILLVHLLCQTATWWHATFLKNCEQGLYINNINIPMYEKNKYVYTGNIYGIKWVISISQIQKLAMMTSEANSVPAWQWKVWKHSVPPISRPCHSASCED